MVLFNSIVSDINNFLWTYVIIVVLIACGIGFTLRTRFVQLTMLPEMLRLLVTDGRSKRRRHKNRRPHYQLLSGILRKHRFESRCR